MQAHANSIPLRSFGATNELVSCIGMGGSHLAQKDLAAKESIRLIRDAIDHGITFMDNSWDYSEGEAERRMGKALADGYRQRAFLMTKIDGRTGKSATEQLEESLRRLKTDCVDLLQHHEVIRYEDADRIVAPGGAGEALEKARKAGKCRYIGFTGHKDPHIHLYMLDSAREAGLKFDAVQMPLNPMDAHFRSFGTHVLPRLVASGIAVLGMKAFGHGVLLKCKAVKPEECLRYALSLPTSVVITGIDSSKLLKQAVTVAANFQPMSREELDSLLARTAEPARNGEFELFKTSAHFDTTAEHPEYLGEELKRVAQLTRS